MRGGSHKSCEPASGPRDQSGVTGCVLLQSLSLSEPAIPREMKPWDIQPCLPCLMGGPHTRVAPSGEKGNAEAICLRPYIAEPRQEIKGLNVLAA
ncbi:hypothetical protein NDU88_001289 [Pleurodeles waltl]|uniref:Uncharacterized protein n=1 Tax=Pleurodeles waltl TaxID=8319 RepID=A0AAV7TH63_PLEWA|nr:hypothetical protein NDU88_001289 [Pleurodeles waltl]